jgi:hypothetical protein
MVAVDILESVSIITESSAITKSFVCFLSYQTRQYRHFYITAFSQTIQAVARDSMARHACQGAEKVW